MAADLAGSAVTVNMLLPGGATATGMVPEEVSEEVRERLLRSGDHGTADRVACFPAGS